MNTYRRFLALTLVCMCIFAMPVVANAATEGSSILEKLDNLNLKNDDGTVNIAGIVVLLVCVAIAINILYLATTAPPVVGIAAGVIVTIIVALLVWQFA